MRLSIRYKIFFFFIYSVVTLTMEVLMIEIKYIIFAWSTLSFLFSHSSFCLIMLFSIWIHHSLSLSPIQHFLLDRFFSSFMPLILLTWSIDMKSLAKVEYSILISIILIDSFFSFFIPSRHRFRYIHFLALYQYCSTYINFMKNSLIFILNRHVFSFFLCGCCVLGINYKVKFAQ